MTNGNRRGRALRAAGLVLAMSVPAIVAAGCAASGRDETNPPVILPGGPGQSARTIPADQAAGAQQKPKPNDADALYVERMIPHHAQALEMTRLVPSRASSEPVRSMADRIEKSQGPEIEAMKGWLRNNGKPVPGTGHGHGGDASQHVGMPGMATPQQLQELAGLTGPAFEKRFVELMIAHHEGALVMAEQVRRDGADVFVEQMADDVIATQTAEITRMRALLR
ncbi:DUF305 domain-containing protein [Allokutzneria albata]|uniref:Uncharacterized conserved protein, DUF305 family n=1 Tax=Allokutzneria albata TaxID=211114 RepID=A0A1G9WNI6_ALLAB|nr:DUF305 domain-containing protein [Allokutzneria albata]SDM85645.1 Uncharacterized conserved protein, DUF305 family [Allokutzneria albata]